MPNIPPPTLFPDDYFQYASLILSNVTYLDFVMRSRESTYIDVFSNRITDKGLPILSPGSV